MNADRRKKIFKRLQRANPTPVTELRYETPFQLLVAVILSAQATDRSVNEATRTLFKVAPDPSRMAALGLEGIKAHIRHIGLFNTKARNVLETSRQILALHSGQVPGNRTALEALPGVGRKTANVVLNTAFGEPTIAVDTHIFRVANRTGLAAGNTVSAVERKLIKVVPVEYRKNAHHWLILHGRYVCTARRPKCGQCILVDLCEYRGKVSHPCQAESLQPD
ncbi:MAG: endonuclease III [Acidiferrobacteraceae bacterium]